MSSSIPKPDFQSSRSKRRSSIGQGAALSAAGATDSAAPDPQPEQPPAPPAPAPEPAARAEAVRPRAVDTRSGKDASKGGGASAVANPPNKRLVGSRDILLSLPEDLKTRMVNTITWSHPYTGIGQQQKFIRKAITDLCERLESDYNQGKPFPEPVVHDD